MIVPVAFATNAERFVREDLPGLNSDVEGGRLSSDAFLTKVQPVLDELVAGYAADPASITRDQARYLLQLLGFMVSSLERHFLVSGSAPGDLVIRTGCGRLLVALGSTAQHPPRDTHYTYWLWNQDTVPLTFTEDAQEHYFNFAVTKTHELHTESNDGLRQICTGAYALSSTDATDAMKKATVNTAELQKHYQNFFRRMKPAFFMTRMRTYLVKYPVDGQVWDGVNAANLAAQMQMDYLTGTYAKDFYAPIVAARQKFLTAEDDRALTTDVAGPSVASRFFDQMIDEPFTSLFTSTPLAAFNELVKAIGFCSATHWSLIVNYLIRPAAVMSDAARSALPVDPTKGTGNMAHGTTERIMHMRRHVHPIRTVISERLLDERERKAVFMFHLEGLPLDDIEKQLGWPSGDGAVALAAGIATLQNSNLYLMDADVPREF